MILSQSQKREQQQKKIPEVAEKKLTTTMTPDFSQEILQLIVM